MSELVAVQSPGSPIIKGIRRAEAVALGGLSVAMVISLGAIGAPISFALLAVAVVLLPRRKEMDAASREQQRLQLTRQMLSEGRSLRARYDLDNVAMRSELEDWIASSRTRIANFPEFAAIYDAHNGNHLGEEIDGRLQRLAEIDRLAQASRRLDLPI
jgi:hypothetical protein